MIRRPPLRRAPARTSPFLLTIMVLCAVVILAAVVYGVLVPSHRLACGAVMLLALAVFGWVRSFFVVK